MISTENDIIILLDSIEKFSAPRMVCLPHYNPDTELCTIEVSIRDDSDNHVRYGQFELPKSEIDAITVSATDNTDIWMEAVEEAVKGKLESLNPGATFTIT